MYPRLPFLILPYTRVELPGWGKLLKWTRAAGAIEDIRWRDAPAVIVRGKNHGYEMRLELSDWSQRMTYFIGRYYELGVQRILDLILNPGDRFVDIGANIGMITLHARSLVGKNGRIDCFEPNPTCAAKILTHLSINNIGNVTIHACALSDHRGELHLNLTSDHSGTATLAKVDGVRHSFLVDVRVGDDVLTGGQPIDVVKIDVEGFELRVLAGMRRTLVAFKPIVITELIESQLNRAGTTSAEVSKFLKDQGYVPFGVGSSRTFLRHELALFAATTNCNDAVWIHPTHKRAEALMEYVR